MASLWGMQRKHRFIVLVVVHFVLSVQCKESWWSRLLDLVAMRGATASC